MQTQIKPNESVDEAKKRYMDAYYNWEAARFASWGNLALKKLNAARVLYDEAVKREKNQALA